MNLQKYFISALFLTTFLNSCAPKQQVSAKTVTFTVLGNCGQCETTIEGSIAGNTVYSADWSSETKLITIVFDSTQTNMLNLQQKIAAVGYDNVGFKGDDSAYANRPECCKYERKENYN